MMETLSRQAARAGRLLPLILVPALLAGCAAPNARSYDPPPRFAGDGPASECARLLSRLDRAAADAGVTDRQAARIRSYPHLRINRFLAADWRPGPDADSYGDWAALLAELDSQARLYEIANLTADQRAEIGAGADSEQLLHAKAAVCGQRLLQRDLADPARRQQLHALASVRDAYRSGYRLAGLYPLTSIPFYAGIRRLHDEIRQGFSKPLAELPVAGALVRYAPESSAGLSRAQVAQILAQSSRNSLAIPLPAPAALDKLFRTFAPVLEVDVLSDDDRIGRPVFGPDGLPAVDTSSAVVYTHASHTRFELKTLLQLNYIIWFPARPPSGALDILAGRYDGINWRVTLDSDGAPLVYDSMHNCGCYHLFMPGPRLRPREPTGAFEEPLLVPQQVVVKPGRPVVRIAQRTHYIQRVYFEPDPIGVRYRLLSYDALRSISFNAERRRSLFDDQAFVPGSERPERFLFWPMGVPNAGAMRQWGHHATAFVGRRHFDDADLLSRYFQRVH